MRRTITALATAALVGLPTTNAVAATRAESTTEATPKTTVVTRRVSGPAAAAHDWGTVKVTLVVRKTTTVTGTKRKVTRRIVAVNAAYTAHTDRMEQALPILRREALQAKSADIDFVSGATDTSEAFVESLQAALIAMRTV